MAERFGHYELITKIATGGMAEIYLARNLTEETQNYIVLKRMLPQLAIRPDFVKMFLNEARLASRLKHHNLVRVMDFGQISTSYFIAMELVNGPHLGSLFASSLRSRQPLPIPLCVYICMQSALGLECAHNLMDEENQLSLNLVHRDISPQNILVAQDGTVKVIDFGVAKASDQQTKTRTGVIKGKVAYMSPEQCFGDDVDRRTDVFALGIVLYELLTRRRLFREKSDLLIMQRITQENVVPPSHQNPLVDPLLDSIVLKSLARQKAERYQSTQAFAEALNHWLQANGHQNCQDILSQWIKNHNQDLLPLSKYAPMLSQATHPWNTPPLISTETSTEALLPVSEDVTEQVRSMPWLLEEELQKRGQILTLDQTAPSHPSDPALSFAQASPEKEIEALKAPFLEQPFVVDPPNSTWVSSTPQTSVSSSKTIIFALVTISLLVFIIWFLWPQKPLVIPPVPSALITIESLPEAEILIDDQLQGTSHAVVTLPLSKHHFIIRLNNSVVLEKIIDITSQEPQTMILKPSAQVEITSQPPGATVEVNTEVKGQTPLILSDLEFGSSLELKLTLENHQPFMNTIQAKELPISKFQFQLTPIKPSTTQPETVKLKNPPQDKPVPQKTTETKETGFLSLLSRPHTVQVYLGKQLLGDSGFEKIPVPSGKIQLKLVNSDLNIQKTIKLTIPANTHIKATVQLAESDEGYDIAGVFSRKVD